MSDAALGLSDVLSGDDWNAAQYLPGAAVATLGDDDPKKKKKPAAATVPATDRILAGDEWEAAQRKSGPAVKQWQIPALPAIPRDAARTQHDAAAEPRGTQIANPFLRELLKQGVDPVLENPLTSAAMLAAPGAAAGISPLLGLAAAAGLTAPLVKGIAQYGAQKLAEQDLPPDVRAAWEQDPERIHGEAAAAQATLLGLGALVHVGVKGAGRIRSSLDYGAGMTEAGAQGVGELQHGRFSDQFMSGVATDQFAGSLERGTANLRATNDVARPAGLVTSREAQPPARTPRAVEGLVVPENAKAGKVTPIETTDAAAPIEERAALDQSVRDYQAQRAEQDAKDLTDVRRGEAERVAKIAGGIQRRTGAAPTDGPRRFFESEHGAEVLGSMAAQHGLPNDASPYIPESPLDVAWKAGHTSATESAATATGAATEAYPEGFSMGGGLTDNRIPGASEIPKTARGSDAVVAGLEPTQIPEGVTPETVALANSLKPSRFRGLSSDELVETAIDARKRFEDAQAAELYHSEGQIGTADWMDRVNNNEETEVYYAKTRAQETTRARNALAQIERELALRGLHGDKLAERIADAQDARAERIAMQEEESLASIMGDDDPFAEPAPEAAPVAAGTASAPAGGPPVSPLVEGTGETRTRGLASAIERKAIANKIAATLGPDLPTYQRVSMADQADQATALLARDPSLARAVALGHAPAPEGLLPESVLVAVERKAVTEGDVATLRELATGQLGEQVTHMGQRIRALAERDPDSPVGAIQQVVDARTNAGAKVPRATEAIVVDLRAKLSALMTPEQLATFLKSLEC